MPDTITRLRDLADELENAGGVERPEMLRSAAAELENVNEELDDQRSADREECIPLYAALQRLHEQSGHDRQFLEYCTEASCMAIRSWTDVFWD